mgnify:CR=1 FL=1
MDEQDQNDSGNDEYGCCAIRFQVSSLFSSITMEMLKGYKSAGNFDLSILSVFWDDVHKKRIIIPIVHISKFWIAAFNA